MRSFIMPMTYLEVGQKAEIVGVELKGNKKMRMMDLGLTVGTKVRCVLKAMQGGLTAYDVKGSVFAFREEDSKKVIIKYDRTDIREEARL